MSQNTVSLTVVNSQPMKEPNPPVITEINDTSNPQAYIFQSPILYIQDTPVSLIEGEQAIVVKFNVTSAVGEDLTSNFSMIEAVHPEDKHRILNFMSLA